MPVGEALPVEVSTSFAVVVFVLLAGFLSSLYGNSYSEPVCRVRLSYSPGRSAFGIWLLIWLLEALSIATQYVSYARDADGFAPPVASFLLAFSFALSGFWAPAFSLNTLEGYVTAAVLLGAAAGLALAASAVQRTADGADDLVTVFLVQPAFSIYAGWVSLAACLSVGIALKVYDEARGRAKVLPGAPGATGSSFSFPVNSKAGEECEYPDYSLLYEVENSPEANWDVNLVPMVIAAFTMLFSALTLDWQLPLAVAWGIFRMRPRRAHIAAFAVAVLSLPVAWVVSATRG